MEEMQLVLTFDNGMQELCMEVYKLLCMEGQKVCNNYIYIYIHMEIPFWGEQSFYNIQEQFFRFVILKATFGDMYIVIFFTSPIALHKEISSCTPYILKF